MTDYYNLAESGLIGLLVAQLGDTYFPNDTDAKGRLHQQVSASDDTILDNGNDYYAITYPGVFPVSERTSSFLTYSWEIQLDLLVRWVKSESLAWATFKPYRDAVIGLINHTKLGKVLNNTNYVRNAVISAEDRPRYIPLRGSTPDNPAFTHLGQVCVVTVEMNVPRT